MSSVEPGAIELPFDEDAHPVVSARKKYSHSFEREEAPVVTPDRSKSVVDDEVDSASGGASNYFMSNPNSLPSAYFIPKFHERPDAAIWSVTSDATTEITTTTCRAPPRRDKYACVEHEASGRRQLDEERRRHEEEKARRRQEKKRRGEEKARHRRRKDSERSSPAKKLNDTRSPSRKKKSQRSSKYANQASTTASQDTDPTAEPSDVSGEGASFNCSKKKVRFSKKARRESRRRELATRKRDVGVSQCCKTVVDEVEGFMEDTLSAFDQIFNVFTLEDKDIEAVAGRIEKAKKQLT